MQNSENVALDITIFMQEGQMHCISCTSLMEDIIKDDYFKKKLKDNSETTINAYDKEHKTFPNTIKIRKQFFTNDACSLISLIDGLLNEIRTNPDSHFTYKAEKPYTISVNRRIVDMRALKHAVENPDLEANRLKITDYLIPEIANNMNHSHSSSSLQKSDFTEKIEENPQLRMEQIHTSMQENSSTESTNKLPVKIKFPKRSSVSYDLLLGGSSLGLGISLMVLEHMNQMQNPILEVSLGCVSTAMTLFIGKHHFQNAIRHQGAMDTLISLGCGGAILYSFLLIMQPPFLKDDTTSSFFDVPLMILGFLTLSHILRTILQNQIKQQENAIENIESTLPQKALLASNEMIDVNDVLPETHIIVAPNEIIPIDSKLENLTDEETISVKEKFLTGNDREKQKKNGDTLYAGTLNTTGKNLYLKTICLVNDSQIYTVLFAIRQKAQQDTLIEWVIKYFLRGVLSIATLSAICWGLFGPKPAISNAIQVFLAVILSACPCGLGLIRLNETMIKLLALEKGILIQKEAALTMDKVTDICIDKCGTSTMGNYELKEIHSFSSLTQEKLLNYAIALQKAIPEQDQTAITKALLKKKSVSIYEATQYKENPVNKGRGGQAIINHQTVTMGNKGLLESFSIYVDTGRIEKSNNGEEELIIYLAIGKQVMGFFKLQPIAEPKQILRPDFISSMNALITQGKTIHILTGDDSTSNAQAVADKLIQEMRVHIHISPANDAFSSRTIGYEADPILYITYGMLPQDKVKYITAMQGQQKIVAMLGDGINDEGAIRAADVGAVIDNDSPARRASDVILNGHFISLIQLISFSKSYHQAYRTSMAVAFGSNMGLVATSAGVFYPITKQIIDPMIVGMGMGGSSLLLMVSIAIWQNIARQRTKTIAQSSNSKSSTVFSKIISYLFSCCKKEQSTSSPEISLLSPIASKESTFSCSN